MNLVKIFKLIFIFMILLLISLVLSFSIFALSFQLFNIPNDLFSKLVLACACISVFVSSCITTRFTEDYKIILSLIFGLIFAIFVAIINLLNIKVFSNYEFLIKIFAIILTSFLSGVFSKFLK